MKVTENRIILDPDEVEQLRRARMTLQEVWIRLVESGDEATQDSLDVARFADVPMAMGWGVVFGVLGKVIEMEGVEGVEVKWPREDPDSRMKLDAWREKMDLRMREGT